MALFIITVLDIFALILEQDFCMSLINKFDPTLARMGILMNDIFILFVFCSTVRCFGVLSGSMLLGMSREELKSVCPEEGGRVFFQLQAVKSAMAVSETMQEFFLRHSFPAADVTSPQWKMMLIHTCPSTVFVARQ